MSIFSSDYEYYAFSTTQPLIPDDSKGDTLSAFLLSALKYEEENVAGNLVAAHAAGLPGLIRQYYNYGRDSYFWGLPTSNFISIDLSITAIGEVLTDTYTVQSVKYALSEQEYLVIEAIKALSWFDYNLIEAQVPRLAGGPTYYVNPLKFILYDQGNGDYLVLWKIVTKDYSSGPAPYQDPEEWPQNDDYYSVEISVSGTAGTDPEYLWVLYATTVDAESDPPPGHPANEVWPPLLDVFYTYPSTEFPENSVGDVSSPFLPIAVFTRDDQYYWSVPEWSNTLQGLLKKINIDAYDFADEFYESARENVPEGLKEHDLFVGFMVNLNKSAELGTGLAEYKFEFIKALHTQSVTTREDFDIYYDQYTQWEIDYADWED